MSKAARTYTTLLGLDKYVQFYSEIYPQQTVEVVVNLAQFWSNNFYHISYSASAVTLFAKLTSDVATILRQLRTRGKKLKTNLADVEAILEILES
jgi:hypothetical protein